MRCEKRMKEGKRCEVFRSKRRVRKRIMRE